MRHLPEGELNLVLARHAVDRDYLSRSRPELFDELWQNPLTRVLAMYEGQVLLLEKDGKVQPELRLLEVDAVPSAQLRVYLGKSVDASTNEPAQTPVVLAVLSKNAADLVEPDATKWHNLRKSGAGLSDRDAGLFSQGARASPVPLLTRHQRAQTLRGFPPVEYPVPYCTRTARPTRQHGIASGGNRDARLRH